MVLLRADDRFRLRVLQRQALEPEVDVGTDREGEPHDEEEHRHRDEGVRGPLEVQADPADALDGHDRAGYEASHHGEEDDGAGTHVERQLTGELREQGDDERRDGESMGARPIPQISPPQA